MAPFHPVAGHLRAAEVPADRRKRPPRAAQPARRARRARHHPAGLALLVLALLVQAFAPDWATLVMRAVPDAAPAALCLADDHPSGPASPPHAHDALCPVCQAFAAVQTALGSTPPPLQGPLATGRRLRSRRPRSRPIRRPFFRPKAREPPPVVRSSASA